MKKTLLLTGALLMAAYGMNAQMNPSGAATFNTGTGTLDLVPGATCGAHVNGAGWSNTTVDFTRSFVLDYEASFTTWSGTGADGHVVVFGNNINNAPGGSTGGFAGGHIGYYYNNATNDFNQSIGIEFDIFENGSGLSDPGTGVNHVMIAQDANPLAVLAPATSIDPGGLSVEDGLFHRYRVEWLCKEGRLRVFYDNNLRIDMPFTPSSVFSNPASVYWGFTAARQSSCSQHLIKNIVLKQSDQCASCMHADLEVYFGRCNPDGTFQMAFSPLASPEPGIVISQYILDFGDGTKVNMSPGSVFSPIHNYAAGSYTVRLIVVGFNKETGECCREEISVTIFIPDCKSDGEGDTKAMRTIGDTGAILNLYPNPTSGELVINLNNGTFSKVVVMDATGKVIYTSNYDAVTTQKINLQGFSQGIYTVEVSGENGSMYRNKIQLNK